MMPTTSWLRTVDLCRYYKSGRHEIHALEKISIDIKKGEFLGVVGSSGSGKSTLLNLLAGLDTPSSGFVEFNSNILSGMSRKQLALYRARSVGMIFQSFNLIPHYTALQNVETALFFTDTNPKDRHKLAMNVLEHLGLSDRISHKPADLSGGEQQRVAVARAIVKKPEILFADEPTGNLDYEYARQIAQLLIGLNREGLTVVMVTHNLEIAKECSHRTIRMQYGNIVQNMGEESTGESRT